jgi:hypothetical protein
VYQGLLSNSVFVLFEQEETEKLPTIKRLFFPTTNTIYIMQEEFESIRHQLSLDFDRSSTNIPVRVNCFPELYMSLSLQSLHL